MSDSIFLHGVALANYRGIGNEIIRVGPFQRFNFLIGPNNAGKSNVLSFIDKYLKQHFLRVKSDRLPRKEFEPLDQHRGDYGTVKMGIGIPKIQVREKIISKKPELTSRTEALALMVKLLDRFSEGDLVWLTRTPNAPNFEPMTANKTFEELSKIASQNTWSSLWQTLTYQNQGSLEQHWIPQTILHMFGDAEITLPEIVLIPAIRQITSMGDELIGWSGHGLIGELSRLQNPGVMERQKLKKFEKINAFFKAVTENLTARIEIPHGREHVLVEIDGKILPLESLGTGIHEVVLIASFCTMAEDSIICIEEPELHLHPLLQRRLIKYLSDETSNQYFIATHSASVIDAIDASIFAVSNEHGRTKISSIVTANSRFEICRDLGYKASDILQANAIIWVEGPSDRVYIRHWIGSLAAELKEGIDYSIMFYGGRLLSHLGAKDTEAADADIEALIAVRKLNRNLAVVIDSDRAKALDGLNSTKLRVQSELLEHGGICWVTDGREVENYVDNSIMINALQMTYPQFKKQYKTGRYEHVLPFKNVNDKLIKEVDKVKVAKVVCSSPANLDVLDLRTRIESLVAFIRASNL